MKAETMTPGGLHIPDSAKERPQLGEIVAVSPDCEVLSKEAEGRTVMYGKYAGTEVEMVAEESNEKEMLLIVSEKDLLGII